MDVAGRFIVKEHRSLPQIGLLTALGACLKIGTPVDAFQHARHLRRRDRHDAVGGRWPDEAAAIEPLGIERRAETIVPEDLHQSPGAAVGVLLSVDTRSSVNALNAGLER